MLSRRLLRTKVLTAIYAFNRRNDNDIATAEKELMMSIDKSYDLYHGMLSLVIVLANVALDKIEMGRQRMIPSEEDLNPNMRFVNNKVIAQLRNNISLQKFIEKNRLSWLDYPHVLKNMYNELLAWEVYREYMAAESNTYTSDKQFIVRLISEFFPYSEDLEACLEDISIYWNGDIEYIVVMAAKTVQKFKVSDTAQAPLMPLYKNEDDIDFVKILFRKTLLNEERYRELIDKNTTNWEVDRIALMDFLVMETAISELVEFPNIPLRVTLNEYIDISKYYCSVKSATFVNGILDRVAKELAENRITATI